MGIASNDISISDHLFKGVTCQINIWIKNDLTFNLRRNRAMLTASSDIKPIEWLAKSTPRKDIVVAAAGPSEISQQTIWMLAVRDQRDKVAFASLFDYFGPRLKGFVMRSGMSSSQAEEVVQDVMLTIWRKAALFDPHRAQVSAWIYQITRNRQIDVIRKEQRPLPEELAQDPGTEPDANQIMAVEKAYLGELTHQEISAQTDLPLGTIKSRIRLGLEKLRHELKELR
jgi:DNA-directed RNA polymerase specialized sigma24 family protein